MRRLQRLLALLAAVAAGPVFAVDATLNFTGTLLQPSCTLDSSTANQTIKLGTAAVADFAAVGATSNPTPFYLLLVDCTATTRVTMTVSGAATSAPGVLLNGGTATQLGVQLLQANAVGSTTGIPLTLNSAVNLGAVDATNSMTIPMVAQFYRLGALVAGSVTATATINFTYN